MNIDVFWMYVVPTIKYFFDPCWPTSLTHIFGGYFHLPFTCWSLHLDYCKHTKALLKCQICLPALWAIIYNRQLGKNTKVHRHLPSSSFHHTLWLVILMYTDKQKENIHVKIDSWRMSYKRTGNCENFGVIPFHFSEVRGQRDLNSCSCGVPIVLD